MYAAHPTMDWMVGNCQMVSDGEGKVKLVKQGKKIAYKIDGPIAAVEALDRAIRCAAVGGGLRRTQFCWIVDHGTTRKSTERKRRMSDELEGWQWGDYGNGEFYRKVIGRDCFLLCLVSWLLSWFYGGVWFATPNSCQKPSASRTQPSGCGLEIRMKWRKYRTSGIAHTGSLCVDTKFIRPETDTRMGSVQTMWTLFHPPIRMDSRLWAGKED